MSQVPRKSAGARRGGRRRIGVAAPWAATGLALVGTAAGAVLAWSDRFRGWILVPLVIGAWSGAAVAFLAGAVVSRRANRDHDR